MKNYYEILELSNSASEDIIKKVYKIKIKQNHPDLFFNEEKQKAENITKELTEAYDVLSNKEKRKEYDIELKNKEKEKNYHIYEKYENIISDLKLENEYLKKVILLKNKNMNKYLDNDINLSDNDVLEEFYKNNKEYNIKQNNNITINPSYFNSIIYDLKQLLFKLLIFFVLLGILLIFYLFTRNNVFKILF